MPIAGEDGSMISVASRGRRVYLHINNTNPILIEGSREYDIVREAGWDVAYDGMEFVL
jgi:pyrroloquinoline quinone biosynthesis protein B